MDWLATETTVQPAVEPFDVAEARAQCRIDAGDATDDALLTDYIKAARQHVEMFTGLRLISQTVKFRRGGFCDEMRLPLAPVASITSVKYLDADGVEQTLSTDVYVADLVGLSPAIRLAYGQSWPSVYSQSDAVRITAVAGYGAAGSNVPGPIRMAMRQWISQWYDNREAVSFGGGPSEIPNSAPALLANYRLFTF